ncbi:hypothetical protein ADL22_12525 [Streptomyces sp. NRRL F-4489]|nr:hypothetical protein ADL22_12525 [Streptomyces sp. NRRL F-4489]
MRVMATNFFCRVVGVNKGQRPFFITWTQETSAPYRRSDRTYVVRIGFRRGLAVGRYTRVLADEDAAMRSIFRMVG